MRNRIRWSQRQVAVCFPLSGVTALFGYVSLHVCDFFFSIQVCLACVGIGSR